MNNNFKLSGRARLAIAVVAGLYLWVAVTSKDLAGTVFYGLAAISSADVAAFDSAHVHLRHYKTGISYGPVGLFVVCALLFPLTIIWYFVVRVRIARGTMPLRAEYNERSGFPEQVG